MKRVMLYFGSFNPIHKGHIALAAYAVDKGLCDELVLVVSPQSPYKQAEELAPEMDRFEMAEAACAASRYPDRIKPSVVEFLLPKPSYTIDTLRYLAENHGADMEFSILMGADQIERLDGWKEYDRILEYPVYVYPRRGERVEPDGPQIGPDGTDRRRSGKHGALHGTGQAPLPPQRVGCSPQRLQPRTASRRQPRRGAAVCTNGTGNTGIQI